MWVRAEVQISKADSTNPGLYSDPEFLAALEQAYRRIDDSRLQQWESLLGLKSPNEAFRRQVRFNAALYFAGEDPAVEDRELLTELRKFLRDLRKRLTNLQRLLVPEPLYRTERKPQIDRGTLQYDALFAEDMLLGYEDSLPLGRARGQSKFVTVNIRRYKAFEAALANMARLVEARIALLAKARVPPRRKLDRERWIARLLYNLFADATGEKPASHVQSNTEKTVYTGKFFEFVDAVLTQVGFRQQPAARGELVKSALKWALASEARPRSPKNGR